MRRISATASIVAIAILASCTPGTANSSGSSVNGGSSVTTGSAGSRAGVGGTTATGPQTSGDAAIDAEDKAIDRKLKSICRGC